MDNGVSKALIEEKFANTDRRIDELRDAVKELAEAMVTSERFSERFNSQTIKIGHLQDLYDEQEKVNKFQEKRLGKTEHYIGIFKYVGSLVIGIVVAIVIVLLSKILGV